MKKLVAALISILVVFTLSGCADKAKLSLKEGVTPYKLTENDQSLLQALGLENNVKLISFKAPKSARFLKAQSYILDDNGQWEATISFFASLGEDERSDAELEGKFAMFMNDDDSIGMHMTTLMGRSSTKPILPDIEKEFSLSSQSFLEDFQKIELNKEIPVAILAHDSGSSLRSYSMDDFFTMSVFEDINSVFKRPDLVQAITLTFMDTID